MAFALVDSFVLIAGLTHAQSVEEFDGGRAVMLPLPHFHTAVQHDNKRHVVMRHGQDQIIRLYFQVFRIWWPGACVP